jgi:hypothetical protein
MKYKLKEHVTVEMLKECGFYDNKLDFENKKYPIEVTEENDYSASRQHSNDKVAVTIDHITYDHMKTYVDTIDVYRYKGIEKNHKRISGVRNWRPYIQDLIDLGYVEAQDV